MTSKLNMENRYPIIAWCECEKERLFWIIDGVHICSKCHGQRQKKKKINSMNLRLSWKHVAEEMIILAHEQGIFKTKSELKTIGKLLDFLKEREK